jgi:uncharacterized protein (TIGR02646 family)
MRYVDIDLLQRPNGWQARADKALNELRSEIAAAEAKALAAGQDVAVARKNAITKGLEKPARQAIWRDLATNLAELSREKCWYSESKNPASDKNVDHFRPKNRVAEDPNHEGYWWRAFDWKNYRYASQWCNQRRVGATSGGKCDHFPLRDSSFRARQETDDTDWEDVVLLDPVDPDDWKLLTFRPDGHPTPAKSKGSHEYERAAISIEVYHLHCKELVDDRRLLAGKVQRTIEDMETLRPQISNPTIRQLYKRQQKELLRLIHPDSEYSAAALAYARAEIYKLEHGHQVKRKWLQEIMS